MREIRTLTRFIENLLMKKPKLNQVDALNVEFLFAKFIVPLSNNIPDWLKLTAEGRLEEAYRLSQSTNNMPEVCGRICPQDRLCEGNCVIEQSGHGTVTIGSVEKFLTETAWENNWIKPIDVKNEINQSIGIIGAGPAGLACAEELRKKIIKLLFTTDMIELVVY